VKLKKRAVAILGAALGIVRTAVSFSLMKRTHATGLQWKSTAAPVQDGFRDNLNMSDAAYEPGRQIHA
jgi:hypothetical protein